MIILTWGFNIYEKCLVNILEYYNQEEKVEYVHIGVYDYLNLELEKPFKKLITHKLEDYDYDIKKFYKKIIKLSNSDIFFLINPYELILFDNINFDLVSNNYKISLFGYKSIINLNYLHTNKYVENEMTIILNKKIKKDRIKKLNKEIDKPWYISLQMCYFEINYIELNKDKFLKDFREKKLLQLDLKEKSRSYYNIKNHIKNKFFNLNSDPLIQSNYIKVINSKLEYSYNEKILWIEKNDIEINPKVSVIMPVYNKERYLDSSIKSILSQTYLNLELIIIEDCSTDDSKELLKKWENNSKIKIIYNEKNSGCYYSRNEGIKIASGDYIAFQDADDYSLSYRIEYQMKYIYRYNLKMCGCNMVRTHINDFTDMSDDDIVSRYVELICCNKEKNCCEPFFGYPTMIIKKEFYDKYGLYIEKRKGMDMEFPERILYKELGYIFPDTDSSWEFFDKSENSLYKKLDKILYYSSQMGENNITNSVPTDEFLQKNLWRKEYI